jgi:hypothetical protein
VGGNGGLKGGNGGSAQLSNGGAGPAVFGQSSGGPVVVQGSATGGNSDTQFGDGAGPSVTLSNAVGGSTTGGGAEAQSLANATGSAAMAQSTSTTSLGLVSLAKTVASSTTESTATTNAIVQPGAGGQMLPNRSVGLRLRNRPAGQSYSTAFIGGASNVAGETFTSLESADLFFDDHVLNLGAASGVTFSYDLVAGGASS